MLIVFAVAALAVLVVVAYLATGRGGGLGPLPDEETGFELPHRPLTSADLKTLRLGKTVWGYRVDQVDQLIKRVAGELATRDARITELERKLRFDSIATGARALASRQGQPASTVAGADAAESTGVIDSDSDSVEQSPPQTSPPEGAALPPPQTSASSAEPTRGE